MPPALTNYWGHETSTDDEWEYFELQFLNPDDPNYKKLNKVRHAIEHAWLEGMLTAYAKIAWSGIDDPDQREKIKNILNHLDERMLDLAERSGHMCDHCRKKIADGTRVSYVDALFPKENADG